MRFLYDQRILTSNMSGECPSDQYIVNLSFQKKAENQNNLKTFKMRKRLALCNWLDL
jgi:hypothetical protein